MDASADLAVYRFAIENLFRQREHVLDAKGERLLSLGSRFDGSPGDAYGALSTADVQPPDHHAERRPRRRPSATANTGRSSPRRGSQADRLAAFQAYHGLYDAVAQHLRDALQRRLPARLVPGAGARVSPSTLDAALFGNQIPTSVVETLIAVAREGVEPLRRYHRLRKRVLGLDRYYPCDALVPMLEYDRAYGYDEAREWVIESVAPLGPAYQDDVRACFANASIDVYENDGKRSGAYSAPVYGVHPYMLLNHNDTLDAVFTLAHEMGHNIHTVLAHRTQPFVYSDYTIFVAEVPSTLNETLLLEYLLARTPRPARADRPAAARHREHRRAPSTRRRSSRTTNCARTGWSSATSRSRPTCLTELYGGLLHDFYGDVFDAEPLARLTWARVPHFYQSPYYVYQYATCFASAARIAQTLQDGTAGASAARRSTGTWRCCRPAAATTR